MMVVAAKADCSAGYFQIRKQICDISYSKQLYTQRMSLRISHKQFDAIRHVEVGWMQLETKGDRLDHTGRVLEGCSGAQSIS